MANERRLRQLGFTEPVGLDIKTLLESRKDLRTYLWNLPPHENSLPVDPATDPLIVQTASLKAKSGQSLEPLKNMNSMHPLRRGRIYWFSRVNAQYTSKAQNTGNDPRYGFQFLWNPDTITTSVAVNLDITPTAKDKFVKVVGAFPSGQMLSVSAVLDRTNDFYAIKSLTENSTYDRVARAMLPSYQYGSLEQQFNKTAIGKIKDLQKYGTIADVEYLYKAINGPGWRNVAISDQNWNSSDIGFLSPTLLKIELGPIAYIGYVNNLQITHSAFTKSMIPIRSTVDIQFNLMATAGLATTSVVEAPSNTITKRPRATNNFVGSGGYGTGYVAL